MQVSHSRVDTFKKCPYQYKLRYIEGLKTFFNNDPSNALVVGTALHTGIEKDTNTAIKEYYENYAIINDQNIDEAIKLEEVIKKCIEVLPPLDNALFETKIESTEFIGYIDLLIPVDKSELTPDDRCSMCRKEDDCPHAYSGNNNCLKNIEVYDMYDFKYSNNVRNYLESGQLHEYKYFFERLNPTKRIRNMYFLFAPKVAIRMKYKNKTNPRDETLNEFRQRLRNELKDKEPQVVQIEYDIEKVKDFLRNAKECRMATKFPKNPTRLCDWCDYQKYCESEGREDLEIMNLPKNERRTVTANSKKKIWLYGAPFSGKTYLANEFPDPLMLNTDGNVKFIDAPYIAIKDEVSVEGRITKRTLAWQVFKDAIAELEKKQNDFKTIVVDLLEDTYEYCRLYMYDQLGISHESDDSFRAWDKVRIEFLSTIKKLMNLDYENIILISHEDTSKDLTKKSGDKVSAIKPNIQDKAALKIAGMVDLVARVIDDEGKRVLSFKTNEVIFGGGRLNVTAKDIPCDYDDLCKVYDDANAGKKVVKEAPKKVEKPEELETADATPSEVETPKDKPKRRKAKTEVQETPEKADNELSEDTEKEDSINDQEAEKNAPESKSETPTRKRRARTETPVEESTEEDKPTEDKPAEETPRRRRRRE